MCTRAHTHTYAHTHSLQCGDKLPKPAFPRSIQACFKEIQDPDWHGAFVEQLIIFAAQLGMVEALRSLADIGGAGCANTTDDDKWVQRYAVPEAAHAPCLSVATLRVLAASSMASPLLGCLEG